jgi:hypothetical protein
MWRIAASMGLMFGAVLWSAIAVIIIFLFVPTMWEALFGPTGGALAAVVVLGLMIWVSTKMMGLADRLSGMIDHRRKTDGTDGAVPPSRPDMPSSWPEYNAAIARNKRWAFYRRTHQYDRLRELELEERGIAQAAQNTAPRTMAPAVRAAGARTSHLAPATVRAQDEE